MGEAKVEMLERGVFFGTAALFALVMVFGGLGPHAPVLNAVIVAAAFPLLVALVLFRRAALLDRQSGTSAVLLILLTVLAGTAQLVPMPATVWRALPGRDVTDMVLQTLGQSGRPWPLSLMPDDTRLTVLSWLPPTTIFFATLAADQRQRRWLAALVVMGAALSSVLALAQLSFGDGTLFLYLQPPLTRYPGLFANYNHQATFLACAVALLPAIMPARRDGRSLAWVALFWIVALFAALITASRAGLILFAAASCISAARLWRDRFPDRRALTGLLARGRVRRLIPMLLGVALLAPTGAIVAGGYRVEFMSSRFESVDADARFGFWPTTIDAIRTYFPYGAGLGTFETIYQIAEPLESIGPYLVNHAHNDYLEFALEAGAAGIVLIVLFILWFGARVAALVRRRSSDQLAWSGVLIVVMVMAHSLVDYPLRTEAIGCIFAFASALLLGPAGERRPRVRVVGPARRGVAE